LAPVDPPAVPTSLSAFTSAATATPVVPLAVAAAAAAALEDLKAKKKLHKSPPHMYNTLAPFVAKQLFDLAVIRKEQCPVTMEDFSAGNTAVMPCGHLFMQFAIEESFKKEPYKCPWCRQAGKPAYV
jgi:hypothetical protein